MYRYVITMCITFSLFLCMQVSPLQAADLENISFELSESEAVVTFFYLTDGEAALIQDGLGHEILINTGSQASLKQLARWLSLLNITELDGLIITKQSEEYNGNTDYIIENFSPKHIYVPPGYDEGHLEKKHLYKPWTGGSKKVFSKQVHIHVLHHEASPTAAMDLSIKFGENRILYMTNGEDRIRQHKLSDVDVIKVPDFGAGSVISQSFLKKVDPQAAIIFNKENRRVNTGLLERLYDLWIDIYHVKQVGTVSIKMSEDKYEVITFPQNQ